MKRIIFLFALLASWVSYAQEEIVLSGDELFGDLRARQIGPALMSGRIIDLESHVGRAIFLRYVTLQIAIVGV